MSKALRPSLRAEGRVSGRKRLREFNSNCPPRSHLVQKGFPTQLIHRSIKFRVRAKTNLSSIEGRGWNHYKGLVNRGDPVG